VELTEKKFHHVKENFLKIYYQKKYTKFKSLERQSQNI